MKEDHGSVVTRNISYDVLKRKFVKKLTEHRHCDSCHLRYIVFINRDRIREKTCIFPHKHIEDVCHLRIRELYVIQIVTINDDLHFGRYVHILREGPVTGSFKVYDGIICRRTLQLEAAAELLQIEFQLSAHT